MSEFYLIANFEKKRPEQNEKPFPSVLLASSYFFN